MPEWIEIKRGKGNKGVPIPPPGTVYVRFSSDPDKDATVESVTKALAKKKTLWMQDDARLEVRRILQRLDIAEEPAINVAVCLAVGSFSRENLRNTRRSLAQMITFLDIVREIEDMNGQSITIYAQDPAFTPVDKELLQSMNITVLEHNPADRDVGPAQAHFGKNAFVADFFMDQAINSTKQLLCSDTRLLLSALSGHIERYEASEQDRAEGGQLRAHLDQKYRRYHFPRTQHADLLAFEGLQFIGKILDSDDDEAGPSED